MKPVKTTRPPIVYFIILLLIVLVTAWGDRLPLLADAIKGLQNILGVGRLVGLEGPVEFIRAIDGDTLVLRVNQKEEKVRLIGIDTPEKHSSEKLEQDLVNSGLTREEMKLLGEQASLTTEALIKRKVLYLELDTSERDRYGRLLAYVYFQDSHGDWIFAGKAFKQLNVELLRAGWADALTIPPNVKYADSYLQAVREARAKKLGMWKIY